MPVDFDPTSDQILKHWDFYVENYDSIWEIVKIVNQAQSCGSHGGSIFGESTLGKHSLKVAAEYLRKQLQDNYPDKP